MMPQPTVCPASTTTPSAGGRLVTTEGRALPLRRAAIAAQARGGLARIELTQVFENPYEEPLRVTYQVPLPSDGAVTGYRFLFGEEEVIGRVEPKAKARERFENAILEGQTAALLEEERSSLFTQEVGNIPPRTAVTIVLTIDQPLQWFRELGRHGWEWRFPTVVGPRYMGAPGRVADAARISTTTTLDPIAPTVSLALEVGDAALARAPHSPSHSLVSTPSPQARAGAPGLRVELAEESATLDRDVVVRWEVEQPRPGVRIDVARPPEAHGAASDAFALLTVLPPMSLRADETVPRDLIVLLDTSGSMGGEPLDQAKRIVHALIDTLNERDELEMIEFSTQARRWKRKAVSATPRKKAKAVEWLHGLRASGGTEMKTGLLAAREGLRPEAQRQVILVSDGYIGFESEIISTVLESLPSGSRLHTVGVGSAVNRSLTRPSARAGRGLEIIVGVGEDPEQAASRLVRATEAPVIVDLQIDGDALIELAPARPCDLYAGAPALLSARVRASGGTLTLRGRTPSGSWEQQLQLLPTEPASGSQAVVALWARERVEDLETLRAGLGFGSANDGKLDAQVEALGVDFQVSTRMTSWVAISKARTVDPTAPSRKEVMPHMLPHGTSVSGFGLRAAAATAPMAAAPLAPMQSTVGGVLSSRTKGGPRRRMLTRAGGGGAGSFGSSGGPGAPPPPPASAPPGPPPPQDKLESFDGFAEGMADEEASADLFLDDAPAEAPAPPEPSQDRPARAAEQAKEQAAAVWSGNVRRVADAWVVEVEVSGALHWDRPDEIQVVFADGRSLRVRLDPTRTTASASFDAGTTLRLVFEVVPGGDAAVGDPMPTQLQLADGTVVDVTRD